MLHGTKVAQAYIAITADGSGINDDILDSMEGADFGKVGHNKAGEFSKGFSKELRENLRAHVNGISTELEDAVDRAEAAIRNKRAISQALRDDINHLDKDGKLNALFEEVGRRVGVDFGEEFESASGEIIRRSVRNAINDAAQKAGASNNGAVDLSSIIRPITGAGGGEFDVSGNLLDKAAKEFEASRERMIANLLKAQDEALKQMEKQENDYSKTVLANRRADNLSIIKMARERITLEEKTSKELLKTRGKDSGIGDAFGRMFGAGSRSNILNTLGKSIGGIINLTEKGAKFAIGFADGFSKAADGATLMQKAMSGFTGGGAMAGLSRGLAGVSSSGPLAAVAVVALIGVFSALASVLSAVVALLVAVSSTIVSALVGAVAVALPAIGALVAAGGLVTAAFTSMTEAQRQFLADAFQPVKAAMTGVGQIMMSEFVKPLGNGSTAVQLWSQNIQNAIKPLEGVMRSVSGSFARAGTTMTAALSGTGFKRFFASLSAELPAIVTNLSSAFGRFLNGVTGLFATLMPHVTRFSQYLNQVAGDFTAWANNPTKANSVTDFVDRAIGSLKSLWGFTKQVGGLLSDLLFDANSQEAGNSIFDSAADALRRYRDAIKRASSDGSLKKWFDDARKFGRRFYDLVESLSDLFTTLDDSGVLDAVGKGIQGIGDFTKVASQFLRPFIKIIGTTLPPLLTALLAPLSALASAVESVAGAFDRARNAMDFSLPSWATTAASKSGGGGNPLLSAVANAVNNAAPSGSSPSLGGRPADPRRALPFAAEALGKIAPKTSKRLRNRDLQGLIDSGNKALDETLVEHGGNMQPPKSGNPNPSPNPGGQDTAKDDAEVEKKKKKWKNPFIKLANSFLKDAPTLADEIRANAKEAQNVLNASLEDAEDLISGTLRSAWESSRTAILDAAKPLSLAYNEAVAKMFDPSGLNANIGSAAQSAAQAVGDSFKSQADTLNDSMLAAMESSQASADQMVADAKASRQQMIDSAQSAITSAAESLKSATNKKDAKAAKKVLKQAEKDLATAIAEGDALVAVAEEKAGGLLNSASAMKSATESATSIMASQSVLTVQNAVDLANGLAVGNATLADYAAARAAVAEKITAANQKLSEAIALRDGYRDQVADAVRSFGSLLAAEAKTIDGVAQELNVTDIVGSLQDRLAKVKKFQENLRTLLALGLSDSAYKQLVDAGVEAGSDYAQALVDGGSSGVAQVNSLTSQFDAAADELGLASSSHLYQAGVDAAQGLVDGLMSLSTELDTAATALGNSIAEAVKRALGIASPSKVLRGMMSNVGDGIALGLDDQGPKVSAAAGRIGSKIAVSPEVAAHEARVTADRSAAAVSGNTTEPKFLWTGDIVTPTEDPHAVAMETLNELTGRL